MHELCQYGRRARILLGHMMPLTELRVTSLPSVHQWVLVDQSTAEYKAGLPCSVPQATEATATVFESRPSQRVVDAGGNGYAGETAAARALIEQAAAAAPTVFESQPQRRSADASAAESVAASAESMAWESQPEASKADVLHRNGPLTSDAEKLIQSAAEQWSSGGDIGVYENAPAESCAHVTHASAVQATTASVFESTPSLSQADAVAAHVAHTENSSRLRPNRPRRTSSGRLPRTRRFVRQQSYSKKRL
eukprot:s4128_g3.t1